MMKAMTLLTALQAAKRIAPGLDAKAEYTALALSVECAIEDGTDVSAQSLFLVISRIESGWGKQQQPIPGAVLQAALSSAKAVALQAKLEQASRR